ncbi:MAG: hypothetical protein ABI298_07780 [Acidimicrobiales bacterium]
MTASVLIVTLGLTVVVANVLTSPSTSSRFVDPHSRQALLKIAQQFNDNYAANRDGLVFDRWDAQSQSVITRAEYIRRHRECPAGLEAGTVESATRSLNEYWKIDYVISGTRLTDYWHYVRGRWLFDLPRSNPTAVHLYRLPAHKYFVSVDCPHAK